MVPLSYFGRVFVRFSSTSLVFLFLHYFLCELVAMLTEAVSWAQLFAVVINSKPVVPIAVG